VAVVLLFALPSGVAAAEPSTASIKTFTATPFFISGGFGESTTACVGCGTALERGVDVLHGPARGPGAGHVARQAAQADAPRETTELRARWARLKCTRVAAGASTNEGLKNSQNGQNWNCVAVHPHRRTPTPQWLSMLSYSATMTQVNARMHRPRTPSLE
jgi:hypothetical protein